MLQGWVIVTVSFAYLGVLFAIAYYGDKRADAGRSIIAKPTIYALSLAVYCTAWTFYGSVGRAASTGIGFLPIYLGPRASAWWRFSCWAAFCSTTPFFPSSTSPGRSSTFRCCTSISLAPGPS